MYKGCVSHLVVVRYLVTPHIRHLYMLQPLIRPHVMHVCLLLLLVRLYVRHARLGLHIASLKVRTTHIWSFTCGFACATAMGYARFRILFGTVIVL